MQIGFFELPAGWQELETANGNTICHRFNLSNTTGEEFMINYSGVTVFAEYL